MESSLESNREKLNHAEFLKNAIHNINRHNKYDIEKKTSPSSRKKIA